MTDAPADDAVPEVLDDGSLSEKPEIGDWEPPTDAENLSILESQARWKKRLSNDETDQLITAANALQREFGVSPVALLLRAREAEALLRKAVPIGDGGVLGTRELVALLLDAPTKTTDVVFSPSFLEWLRFLRLGTWRPGATATPIALMDIGGAISGYYACKEFCAILKDRPLVAIADALSRKQSGPGATRGSQLADAFLRESALLVFREVFEAMKSAHSTLPRGKPDPSALREVLTKFQAGEAYVERLAAEVTHHRACGPDHEHHMTLRQRAAIFLADISSGSPETAASRRPPYSKVDCDSAETALEALERATQKRG